MARWLGHTEYKRLLGELAATSDRDFERRVLPLLRPVARSLIGVPALGSFDRCGADLISWKRNGQLGLVVQCKGFKAMENELGSSQVTQCVDSIKAFARSGLHTECFLLVHNRSGKNADFRRKVEAQLEALRVAGCADRAVLWDLSQLGKQVADAMRALLIERLEDHSRREVLWGLDNEATEIEPLAEVPFRHSELRFDRHRLTETKLGGVLTGDPLEEFRNLGDTNLCLLLGGAGFGKTTTVKRSLGGQQRTGFYFRAANLTGNALSTKDLLTQFTNLRGLFDQFPAEDGPLLESMARSFMAALLTDAKRPVYLVVDGLDESTFLSRRGGLQWLFNSLLDVRVPVFLVAREEFWVRKRQDFESSFGLIAQTSTARNHVARARLLELQPWENQQISALARRYRDRLQDPVARGRIDALLALIDARRYHELYGDIPKRPLFLTYILETVAESGVHASNLRELLLEWVRLKIRRDIRIPFHGGGHGRAPIASEHEGADETMRLAFSAMKTAARLMTQATDGNLELLPWCLEATLLNAVPGLETVRDATGLVLHSLLLPVPRVQPEDEPSLRFAHQVHHELFLALAIEDDPGAFQHLTLPESVVQWLRR